MNKSNHLGIGLYCASVLVVAMGLSAVDAAGAKPPIQDPRPRSSVLVEPGPRVRSVLHADGTIIEADSRSVWRPMCGSDTSSLSSTELEEIASATRAVSAAGSVAAVSGGVAGTASAGFDLAFSLPPSMPEGALEAFQEVERFVESQFTDSVTVWIEVVFLPMGGSLLGATENNSIMVQWPVARDGLLAGMDADDLLQDYLPVGSTIPVRYSAASESVTDETRLWVSVANYLATIGSASGYAARLTFNSDFFWDYTPPIIDDGAHSFQDVIIHEIGHVLGFTSGADFRAYDIELLDVYRFQQSDGGGTDHNPDTLEEFAMTARLVDFDPPVPFDDHDVVTDLIFAEYRMADGTAPNQASHFYPQNPGVYLMDPSLASGETFYPNYYRIGDLNVLDAIGWDYPAANTICNEAIDLTCGRVTHFDNFLISNSPSPTYSCGAGAAQDGTLWFKFVADSESARLSTCQSREPDSTLAVYEGDCGSLVEIGCSEDYPCEGSGGLSSMCLGNLSIGETYYVQVSAATSADRGVYSLEIACSCEAGCADTCCVNAEGAQAEPASVDMNRFISLVPGNPGRQTAIRVVLTDLYNPSPPDIPGSSPPDFSAFEGRIRWVGPPRIFVETELPPTVFRGAELQCAPHFRNWGDEGVIKVYGPEIMPSSTYEVQALDEGCYQAFGGEATLSSALTLTTARWGDVAEPLQDPDSPEFASQPNVLDVANIVDHLKFSTTALGKTRVQLRPNLTDPSELVNVLDVASSVDAVKSKAYPHAGPVECPQ